MSTLRSLKYSFLTRYGQFLLQMIASVILARLLTPEDIGLFSVTVALAGFAHILRDFGVGEYLIQEKDLTQDRIRAAAGLTTLFAWVMAILILVASGPLARFYDAPGMQHIFFVMAANFALIPFGSITMAYLKREMRFDILLRIILVSSIVQPVVSVACAFHGLGYMSPAWGSFSSVVTTVLMAAIYRPAHLPFWPALKEVRRVASYSSWASGNSIFSHTGKSIPEILLGKLTDMHSVGLFNRAQGAVDLFDRLVSMGLSPVLLPYFSKEARERGDIKKVYLYAVECYLGLAWPFFVVMAFLAFPLIRILYGDQWDGAVPVAQALCFGAVIVSSVAMSGEVLKATGAVKDVAKISAAMAVIRGLVVVASVPFGFLAVAWALAASTALRVIFIYRLISRNYQLQLREYMPGIYRSGKVTLLSAFVPIVVYIYFGNSAASVLEMAVIGGAGAFIGWVIGIHVFRHPIKKELLHAINQYRQRR